MRLGILGDIHGYLPGSDRRCIDFAVEVTSTVALDVVQPRLMLCGHAHFFWEAHTATSAVYALNQLPGEYYILDTSRWALERYRSGALL